MSYSPQSPYLPAPPQYYPSGANVGNPVQIVSPPRSDLAQRKRPKYTRSKTGCLTCRVKKIKCDETKPNCMRCTHGSRDCSWPEGVPTRKKNGARRDDTDGRPSTAGSSGLSEASTPPGRDNTPPRRAELDINLVPLSSRPSSNGEYAPLHPLDNHESNRRSLDRSSGYSHSHQSSNPAVLSMIPEAPYPSRYDHSYLNGNSSSQSSRQIMPSYRTLVPPPSANQWNHGAPEPLDPYYHSHHGGMQERTLVGHSSGNDHSSHNRYQ